LQKEHGIDGRDTYIATGAASGRSGPTPRLIGNAAERLSVYRR